MTPRLSIRNTVIRIRLYSFFMLYEISLSSGVEEFEMFEEFKEFEMFQCSRVQVLRVQGFKCCAFKGSNASRSRVQVLRVQGFKSSKVSEFQVQTNN